MSHPLRHAAGPVFMASLALAILGCKRNHQSTYPDAAPSAEASHPIAAGPDAARVCDAASSKVGDQWERFGHVIPVQRGGTVYIVQGDKPGVAAALAPLGLRFVTLVSCPGRRVVAWVPGTKLPNPELHDTFAHAGIGIDSEIAFSPAQGREFLDRQCSEPAGCCAQAELACRYSSTTEAEMRGCIAHIRARSQQDLGPACP